MFTLLPLISVPQMHNGTEGPTELSDSMCPFCNVCCCTRVHWCRCHWQPIQDAAQSLGKCKYQLGTPDTIHMQKVRPIKKHDLRTELLIVSDQFFPTIFWDKLIGSPCMWSTFMNYSRQAGFAVFTSRCHGGYHNEHWIGLLVHRG